VPDTLGAVSRNLTAYRVMAAIVGVLLVVLCLVGVPLANFDGSPMWGVFDSTPTWFATGSDAQHVGELIFLFSAFLLSRRAGWDLPFTLVTLVCGTVPLLSFWAERRATRRVRAEHPELA
jgi:integral membrane protein